MYAKCGSLEDARTVFDGLGRGSRSTMAAWTTMIAGYAQQGMGEEALRLYSSMRQQQQQEEDEQGGGVCHQLTVVTLVCLLQACASVGAAALHVGKQLHAQIDEEQQQGLLATDDVVLGGSLVNMYAKCGCVEGARRLFDRLPDKNVVTWTAMIAGYAQQGMGQEAVSLYERMMQQQEGGGGLCSPDCVTYVCLLQACATMVSSGLPLGKRLHAEILKKQEGVQLDDVAVGAALVNMYAKCGGSMRDAQQVFDSIPDDKRSVEAWGALIGGYTRHGDSAAVLELLGKMKKVEGGVRPSSVTYLSVLTACSHVGLVDKARFYFAAMRTEDGIVPGADHYTCMMDVLGRAGEVEEAMEMAQTMPFAATSAVWHTLLGACQKWSNVEIGRQAFEFAVRLDERDCGAHVLMANVYARAGLWEEAEAVKAMRVKCGAWKEPGRCWWSDDVTGVVRTFVAGGGERRKKQVVVEDSGGAAAAVEVVAAAAAAPRGGDEDGEVLVLVYGHIQQLASALCCSGSGAAAP